MDHAVKMELPRTVEDISAEFLSALLGQQHPGVAVRAVDVGSTHQGTSTALRILLDYKRNDARLPASMFLKASFVAHDFAGGDASANEARFYTHIAPGLEGAVNCPRGYAGVVDAEGRAIVLLEDLEPRGALFQDPVRPIDVDTVAAGLEQLAGLHARHWGGAARAAHQWLPEISSIFGVMRYLVGAEHFAHYISQPRADNIATELTDRDRIAAAVETLFDSDRQLPQTLVHGDPHLGNTFVESSGRPGFLDWQFMGSGAYIWDVSYYVTSSLTPSDRASAERELLELYRSRLSAGGVDAPSADELWLAHRRHMLHGFLALFTPEQSQPEIFARTMGERFAQAAVELETLEALT